MRRVHTPEPMTVRAVTACAAPAAALMRSIAQLMANLALNPMQTKGSGLPTGEKTITTCEMLFRSESLLIVFVDKSSADLHASIAQVAAWQKTHTQSSTSELDGICLSFGCLCI